MTPQANHSTWLEIDDQAVKIARALAMDAVQKVGNGHPGTAMALAPVAYTLFQRFLKHDPSFDRALLCLFLVVRLYPFL